MSEVEEREERFLDALAQLDDNVLQHEYILSFASCLDMLAPEERTDENALAGCTADAWLEKDRDAALRHAARWFKTAGEFLAA